MDRDDDRLLKIGVFSMLSRISVRMLRYYQECGVLAPAVVDPLTGHRRYRPEQLADAYLVAGLRDAGFDVEVMVELLSVIDDPARVDVVIESHGRRLRAVADHTYAQLVALDRVGSTLKENPVNDVRVMTLPEMAVASLRRTIPTYADEGGLWKEIMLLLERSGASFPAGGISGATFHDPEFRESEADVEVWIQVDTPFPANAPLECRTDPERDVVCGRMVGDYSQMPAITQAMGIYVVEHHLTTGPMFNIYRVSPALNPDPSSWITDICFPLVRE